MAKFKNGRIDNDSIELPVILRAENFVEIHELRLVMRQRIDQIVMGEQMRMIVLIAPLQHINSCFHHNVGTLDIEDRINYFLMHAKFKCSTCILSPS
jgi:hypothetical protein